MRLLAAVFLVFWSTTASAQLAMPCKGQADFDAIVEPWDEFSRTYSNGDVRIALLDAIEPAAAAMFLLILHPPRNEVGARTCTLIGLDDGLGYAGVFFTEIEAAYDPAIGLQLTVPAIIYLPDQSFQNSALVNVQINQATGDVFVTQELGAE